MKILKDKKGFTLLELLVVLAIIGILVGLAVGGIRIVQEVNRDTQRKVLARDGQLILESFNEKNNYYPTNLSFTQSGSGMMVYAWGLAVTDSGMSKVNFAKGTGTVSSCGGASYFTGTEVSAGQFSWCYSGGGKAYRLYVKLERNANPYDGGNM